MIPYKNDLLASLDANKARLLQLISDPDEIQNGSGNGCAVFTFF